MLNILVEIKNEYTNRTNNILSKMIYEGLSSIYLKAKEVSKGDDVLKIFQSFLKRVPKWNDEILDNEVNRIKDSIGNDNKFNFLKDLIMASIRATFDIIIFGMQSRPYLIQLRKKLIEDFDFKLFISEIYVNCSKEVYNNPFLFYHNYSPVEIKRNQREVLEIIKKSIEHSIKNFIPIEVIVKEYLDDSTDKQRITVKIDYVNQDFDNQDQSNFIDDIVKKDIDSNGISNLLNNNNIVSKIIDCPEDDNQKVDIQTNFENNQNLNNFELNDNLVKPMIDHLSLKDIDQRSQRSRENLIGGNSNLLDQREVLNRINNVDPINKDESINKAEFINKVEHVQNINSKDFQDKLLNIIEEKNLDLTKDTESFESTKKTINSEVNNTFISKENDINKNMNTLNNNEVIATHSKNGSSIERVTNKSIDRNSNSVHESTKNSKSNSELDSKLEKLLKNDLGESDTESSIADNQSNYQEVFSNSNLSNVSSNTANKNEELNKNKFFSNYLQI